MTSEPATFIAATYEQLAQLGESSLCCSPIELYSSDDLAALPEEILRLSSGCGHPVEDADIQPGTTVLDIGSGAGADALLAARATGAAGTVIGVDPSVSMRERATRNAADLDIRWVEFRDGTAEHLPVADNTVDLVISNCVLSLSTDPTGAWTEIARTLRPGGRIVVSDIVGGAASESLSAKTRCETGIEWPHYRAMLQTLGFTGIRPVRVRAARYRDGSTARSVTIRADHGRRLATLAIDLFVPGDTTAVADDLAADLTRRHRDRVDVRVLHSGDPDMAAILALLTDAGGEAASPLTTAIDGAIVAVCADDLSSYVRDLIP